MTFKHVRPAKARTFDKKRDGYLLSAVTPKNTVAEVKRNGWRFAITSEKSYSATGKAMNTFVQKCIPEGYAIDGEIAFEDFSKRPGDVRSEEHTSELQSLRHLVCRLLLEKKK